MKRIAIVVQRCHESVVGGSEALAWQYARLLSAAFEVEVLTSTATDHTTWSNVLAPCTESRDGITIRRFPVAVGRTPYWDALYHRMLIATSAIHDGRNEAGIRWREALQEEFIRSQGPCCPELEAWLRQHTAGYAAVLFCTYLYPTTYFAIQAVPATKAIVIPTLHDEPPAYLPVFAERYARYAHRIWLTSAEQRTAANIWKFDEGEVLGMAVEHTEATEAERRSRPYLLYCGRIEAGKGCDVLLNAFERMPSRGRTSLVFTGADHMGLPRSPDIEYLGFVDETRKSALMAGAAGLVLPSQYESFSIVALEAMAQRTPILVNGRCEVMRDHVERSGGGWHYASLDDMVAKMEALCTLDPATRMRIGDAGRAYVLDNYREDRVRRRLTAIVEEVTRTAARENEMERTA